MIWAITPTTRPDREPHEVLATGDAGERPEHRDDHNDRDAPVKSRLMYSIQPCPSAAPCGTRWPGEQFGQSEHPSPDWVSRTAPPVTMMAARSRTGDEGDLAVGRRAQAGPRRVAGRGGRTVAAYAAPTNGPKAGRGVTLSGSMEPAPPRLGLPTAARAVPSQTQALRVRRRRRRGRAVAGAGGYFALRDNGTGSKRDARHDPRSGNGGSVLAPRQPRRRSHRRRPRSPRDPPR